MDCLDGSDEAECGPSTAPPPAASTAAPAAAPDECAAPALRCDNGTRCVPLLQLCDGRADCADGADEADRCGNPLAGERATLSHTHTTMNRKKNTSLKIIEKKY